MAESWFNVKNHGVLRVRLEPTDISAEGTAVSPKLILKPKLQLLPAAAVNYTLLRLAGKIYVCNETTEVATFEAAPLAERSSPQTNDRQQDIAVPLDIRRIQHIEKLRNGKDLFLKITLVGLVAIHPENEFERLRDIDLQVTVPRSHWTDHALNRWGISHLRLLEIEFPSNGKNEMAIAESRLGQAEQFYRTGDYPHVLTELRSAFAAVAECYSAERADRNLFERMLVNTHPRMREKLRDAFHYFSSFLNLGPHEPSPTPEIPIPISRHDARFALVVAHAIFEYFSCENWPGI